MVFICLSVYARRSQGEERRRANQEAYKSQIAQQKQLRLDMYARERQAELDSVSDGREEEEYRKAVVAEARRRLLEEHARRLNGFLPKGSLQNQEEARIFRAAAGGMGEQQQTGYFEQSNGFQQTQGYQQQQQQGYNQTGYNPSVSFKDTGNFGNTYNGAQEQKVGY
jgi:hypothetical protein